MSMEATFGQIVKTHRREVGLTQEELARRLALTLFRILTNSLHGIMSLGVIVFSFV